MHISKNIMDDEARAQNLVACWSRIYNIYKAVWKVQELCDARKDHCDISIDTLHIA